MIILTGNRASGKTYNLFANCEAQRIPIIVASKDREDDLKIYGKELGFDVEILNICSDNFGKYYYPKVAIDNIEELFSEIFGKTEILYATALGTVVDLSKNRKKECGEIICGRH